MLLGGMGRYMKYVNEILQRFCNLNQSYVIYKISNGDILFIT